MDKKLTKKQLAIINIFNAVSLEDQDILIRRFVRGETQAYVGERKKVTAERIRQLEEAALKRINENL